MYAKSNLITTYNVDMINLRNVRSCPVLNLSDEALKSNIWSKVESMVLHMFLFKKNGNSCNSKALLVIQEIFQIGFFIRKSENEVL